MRVTDEMVESAYQNLSTPINDRGDVRLLLEAALADVPEPGEWASVAGRLSAEVSLADKRISELEARLEDAILACKGWSELVATCMNDFTDVEVRLEELAKAWEKEADDDGSLETQHDEGGTLVSVLRSCARELRKAINAKREP